MGVCCLIYHRPRDLTFNYTNIRPRGTPIVIDAENKLRWARLYSTGPVHRGPFSVDYCQ